MLTKKEDKRFIPQHDSSSSPRPACACPIAHLLLITHENLIFFLQILKNDTKFGHRCFLVLMNKDKGSMQVR
jgi:hypothetical protein